MSALAVYFLNPGTATCGTWAFAVQDTTASLEARLNAWAHIDLDNRDRYPSIATMQDRWAVSCVEWDQATTYSAAPRS
ncbi:MAG: hypothetical protein R3F17_09840 [Planctomycetota bacterium]